MAAEMRSEIQNDHVKSFDSLSIISHNCSSGPSLRDYQKLKITECTNEFEKIAYLVDAHVPNLRERTAFAYHLQAEREKCKETAEEFRQFKKMIFPPCNQTLMDGFNIIMQQIAELPKEWTIVQLTTQYSAEEHINFNHKRYCSSGLHITVFNCGTDKAVPFVVTLPPPAVNGAKLELMQAHMDCLADYQAELNSRVNQKAFKNYQDKLIYVQKLEAIEMCLKETIQNISCHWMREWRCLLSGKFHKKAVDNFIRDELEEIIKNVFTGQTVSNRAKELLYYVAKGASHLSDKEIISSVAQIFGEKAPLKDLVLLIKKLNVDLSSQFTNFAKHPLILVIDENLDSLHWEMMNVLKEESVTRVPSLHFAYLLFKMHEKDMENGYKIISNYKNGQYIVNPESNLAKMEIRMMGFFKYWLPDWKGINNRAPSSKEFCAMLEDSDIFSYCGHGNGTHIMSLKDLRPLQIKAVVLMFGCASTRIQRQGPQSDNLSSYHVYLTSRCPSLLGMLWPVHDLPTDQITTYLLSNWLPSTAPIPWENVDKRLWVKAQQTGEFTSTNVSQNQESDVVLSRALANTKHKLINYVCLAACVVRGLPIKIKLINS